MSPRAPTVDRRLRFALAPAHSLFPPLKKHGPELRVLDELLLNLRAPRLVLPEPDTDFNGRVVEAPDPGLPVEGRPRFRGVEVREEGVGSNVKPVVAPDAASVEVPEAVEMVLDFLAVEDLQDPAERLRILPVDSSP